ncbi:MAG TPA: hypothetical protein VJH89_00780 [Patescibacteria group bacterium]|nr:hypothetical protein [Patescibacteria group bacterium]
MAFESLEHITDDARPREDVEDAISEFIDTYGIEAVEEVLQSKRSQRNQEHTPEQLH